MPEGKVHVLDLKVCLDTIIILYALLRIICRGQDWGMQKQELCGIHFDELTINIVKTVCLYITL